MLLLLTDYNDVKYRSCTFFPPRAPVSVFSVRVFLNESSHIFQHLAHFHLKQLYSGHF